MMEDSFKKEENLSQQRFGFHYVISVTVVHLNGKSQERSCLQRRRMR